MIIWTDQLIRVSVMSNMHEAPNCMLKMLNGFPTNCLLLSF